MFKYFWNKLKDFIVSRSRLTRVTMVFIVVAIIFGLFGVLHPAYADLWDDIASIFAAIFILIASILGHILVLIIGVLLDIVSYNDFMDATAVNTGWIIVRDVCNLFFVLILLVIGFGSILRLENFKFNKLLGKLVIMIVLVNFSKMIAGFFIDISQVVLMTFANAFSSTAAANFTKGLRLKEMLGLYDENAVTGIGDQLGAWEKMGVALLPVVLLIVAIFVMGAMVVVFLMRIIMLWVLIVLSPLAYLLSVLPSSKTYADKWWQNFTKWVVTGPALAFFIWFGLTLIASGGTESVNLSGENQAVPISGAGAAASPLAAGVGAISSSDNLLQFAFAIGLFIIALVMAQSLGGIAGSIAGKTLGKLQGMGAGALKMAGAPLRGAKEVAKMGGRKVRRTYRDSKLGKYTNVGAMIEGAKQRGEQVESDSRSVSVGAGRDLWDKRPEWMGGGRDVPSAEMQAKRRIQRRQASEMTSMQKEQKGNLLIKQSNEAGGSVGQQTLLERQSTLLAAAADSHLDDAMSMPYFQHDQAWNDEFGQNFKGFAARNITDQQVEENHADDVTRARREIVAAAKNEKGRDLTREELAEANDQGLRKVKNNLMFGTGDKAKAYGGRVIAQNAESEAYFHKAMVSKNHSAKPEDIDESGAIALYEIEDLTKKNKHFETGGEARYNKAMDRIAPTSYVVKKATVEGEFGKQNERGVGASHPHNFSEQIMSQDGSGRIMRIIGRDPNSIESANAQSLLAYGNNKPDDFNRFSFKRHYEYLGDFDDQDQKLEMYNDDLYMDHMRRLYENNPAFVRSLEKKVDSQGYKLYERDKEGNIVDEDNPLVDADNLGEAVAQIQKVTAEDQAAGRKLRIKGGDKWKSNITSDAILREKTLKGVESILSGDKGVGEESSVEGSVSSSTTTDGSIRKSIKEKKDKIADQKEEIKAKRKEAADIHGQAILDANNPNIPEEENQNKFQQAKQLEAEADQEQKEVEKAEREVAKMEKKFDLSPTIQTLQDSIDTESSLGDNADQELIGQWQKQIEALRSGSRAKVSEVMEEINDWVDHANEVINDPNVSTSVKKAYQQNLPKFEEASNNMETYLEATSDEAPKTTKSKATTSKKSSRSDRQSTSDESPEEDQVDPQEEQQVNRDIDDADDAARRVGDSLRGVQVNLDERSIREFSNALQDALNDINLGDLDKQVFGDKIEVIAEKLQKAAGDLPKASRKAVMDQINSVRSASISPMAGNSMIQTRILRTLQKLDGTLRKSRI